FRRDADHVEQRDGAVARKRRAEMLHLIGARHAVDTDERRDLPIVAGEATDDAAERAPVGELARGEAHIDEEGGLPPFVEMVAVTRRAPGERGAQRRRPTLEIRARAAPAVGID